MTGRGRSTRPCWTTSLLSSNLITLTVLIILWSLFWREDPVSWLPWSSARATVVLKLREPVPVHPMPVSWYFSGQFFSSQSIYFLKMAWFGKTTCSHKHFSTTCQFPPPKIYPDDDLSMKDWHVQFTKKLHLQFYQEPTKHQPQLLPRNPRILASTVTTNLLLKYPVFREEWHNNSTV